jgi:hypothetical protein
MADNYRNETYLMLIEKLGPQQSQVLIEKLTIDLRDIRRGLHAALSAKACGLLNEPSHVLISLSGVIGATELCDLARKINDYVGTNKIEFPLEWVTVAIFELDRLLNFLKSDKEARGQAI